MARSRAGSRGCVHPPDARRGRRAGSGRNVDDGGAEGPGQMNGGLFSFSRWLGIVGKEFIQLKRDRLTFGMIIGIPVIQLVLFGYAINADPKRLPTAVLAADSSQYSRTLLSAMQTSGYYRLDRFVSDESELEAMLARGEVQFAVTIPENFGRKLVR